ncbi:hypothetical protein HTZ84_04975 [Haloterrigena sp. SYSU A558-1]|uniref:Uncharacterized protein n=1 Tax=Haloterrigena gelatinilytica TaxID=2741724 RepID=A0ABX2LEY9_9EURY|nr:hypothetical protein [Haloterrigena gelatinilytica]NUC71669.1 hypothetical protein [Haloterrigena gelatinilytica]
MNRNTTIAEAEEPNTVTLAELLAANIKRELHRLNPEATEDINVNAKTGQKSRSDPVQPVLELDIRGEKGDELVRDVVVSCDVPCAVDFRARKRSTAQMKYNFISLISTDNIMELIEFLEEQEGEIGEIDYEIGTGVEVIRNE